MSRSGLARIALIAVALVCASGSARAADPADALKGRIIISDKTLPMRWSSVGAYVAQMKSLNKGTIWYDKKTGKAKFVYAAFFSKPVEDVQVNLVFYDVTGGQHQQKFSTENFMTRGDRALFNSVELDKEDLEGNRKYLVAIEHRRRIIASGTFVLRVEGPHYSGKVTFTDDEAKDKKEQE